MNKESSRKSPSTDSTSLKCAWRIIGRECNETNLAFLNCKAENDHPTACLYQGEKAVACGLRVLRTIEEQCGEAFAAYNAAMKKNWHQFDECRKEEAALIACWKQKAEQRAKQDS